MFNRPSRRQVFVPLLFLLLLALPLPVARAAGCVHYDLDDADRYVNVPASNFLRGAHTIYADSSCQTPFDYTRSFGLGTAFANSGPEAIAICEANMDEPIANVRRPFPGFTTYYCEVGSRLGSSQQRWEELVIIAGEPDAQSALANCRETRPFANHIEPHGTFADYWVCYYVWSVGSGGRGGRGGSSGGVSSPRGCSLGINLPLTGLRLHAFDGMGSGIQFRRLDNCGVGDQSVIDMGFLDAVDVWSNIGSGYSVCFPQAGRIVFLDAATSPRTLMEVDNVIDGGYTCAAMNRAGTMVLVQALGGTVAQTSTTTRRPGTNDSIDDAISLDDCEVTPRFILRFRAGPWDRRIGTVPKNATVLAIGRTRSWFNVTYKETDGWIAAWLTTSEGDCEWSTEEAEPTPTGEAEPTPSADG